MDSSIVRSETNLQVVDTTLVPALASNAAKSAVNRYPEFFTAGIRNKNTRLAYLVAVTEFTDWCEARNVELAQITPVIVAAYSESLGQQFAAPTVKQRLAAITILQLFSTCKGRKRGHQETDVRCWLERRLFDSHQQKCQRHGILLTQ